MNAPSSTPSAEKHDAHVQEAFGNLQRGLLNLGRAAEPYSAKIGLNQGDGAHAGSPLMVQKGLVGGLGQKEGNIGRDQTIVTGRLFEQVVHNDALSLQDRLKILQDAYSGGLENAVGSVFERIYVEASADERMKILGALSAVDPAKVFPVMQLGQEHDRLLQEARLAEEAKQKAAAAPKDLQPRPVCGTCEH